MNSLRLVADLQFVERVAFFHDQAHLLHHLVELRSAAFDQALDMCLLEELEFFKGDNRISSSNFQIELVSVLAGMLVCFRGTKKNIQSVPVPSDLTHQTSRNATSLEVK